MTTTYLHFQLDERRQNILAKNFLQTHLLQRDLHHLSRPRRDRLEEPPSETSPAGAGQ